MCFSLRGEWLLGQVRNGNTIAVKAFLKNGGDVNVTDEKKRAPLREAVINNQLAITRLLLNAEGIDVNIRDAWGQAPIHLVARTDIAKLLIEHGADINAKNSPGRGPLFDTIGRPNLLKVLVEAGANVNQPDNNGFTPLMEAVRLKKWSAIKLMGMKGDWDRQNRHGKSALDYADRQILIWLERQLCKRIADLESNS